MTARFTQSRRRLTALLASFALIAAAALVVAGPSTPAQAAGSCNLVAPARWVVASPYRKAVLSVSAGCAAKPVGVAAWELFNPSRGAVGVTALDSKTPTPMEIEWFDDIIRVGVFTWRGGLCLDGAYLPCAQNAPTTDVRVGGWAGLTAVRSGSAVTVSTSSARYAYSVHKFVPWGGIRGTVQTRTSSTAPWVNLKWVYPGATGKTSFRYASSTVRDYRVVFPTASMIWGATSKTVRR
jgi:hypothetical protein